MGKPDWKDAPEWANYLAQDRDGAWVWFANKPDPVEVRGFWKAGIEGGGFLINRPTANDAWRETLERRPWAAGWGGRMTDQQLLELAAKAVGMPSLHDANGIYGAWVGDHQKGHWWNPLEDDGDSLRLAFALGIKIHWFGSIEVVRRAIVRAAAEIGKSMQEKH